MSSTPIKFLDIIQAQNLINEIKTRLDTKQNLLQYSVMPTNDASWDGKIIQYTGTTTENYKKGRFYVSELNTQGNRIWTEVPLTPDNYIELKSEQRMYLSPTVPTGNIPEGSVGMGFDESVYTYNSGTKVSKGVLTANLFDDSSIEWAANSPNTGDVQKNGHEITLTGNASASICYYNNIIYPAGTYTFSFNRIDNETCYYIIASDSDVSNVTINGASLTASSAIASIIGQTYAGYKSSTSKSITIISDVSFILSINPSKTAYTISDIMLNTGSTALPYEPYGKQFPFYANGQSLADYTIYGADGGVGDITAQLFDVSTATQGRIIWATGAAASDDEYLMSDYIPVEVGKTYTCSTSVWFIGYDSNDTYLGTYNEGEWDKNGLKNATTFVNSATLNAAKIRLLKKATSLSSVMLNSGTTALPYEPYGKYKIPVICGNTTTNIYVDSPLDDGDSIDYATAHVAIPTVDGENTLICDTSVQPSKVSLTYTGWHSDLDKVFESIDNKQDELTFDNVPTENSTNPVKSGGVYTALAGKQATIDSSHKLDADLVDDTNSTNKFVTVEDKTTWNNKQDALTFDSTPTSESTNPVTSGGVYTALEEKLDILPSSSLIKIGMPEIKSETGLKGYVTLYSLRVIDAARNKIALVINSFSNDISLSIARTGVLIYKLDATRQASDVNADNMIVENKETLGLVDGGRNNENRYSPNVSNNIDGVPYSVVLRPYVKLSDDTYVYGDIIETSYTEVATKYPDYTISSLPVQAATGISFTMRWNIDDTKTISEMGMIYASGEYDRIDNSTPNTTTIPVPALCNHGMCSNIISDNGDGVSMVGYCIVDGVTYYTDTVTGYYNELVKLSLGPNYLELKSGRREYLSTTVPTGNIPIGSVGMGFNEGIYTYKSGTKVTDGEPTANLFDVSDYSIGTTSFITKQITLEPNTTYTMSSNCPLYNLGALIVLGNDGESFTTANNGVYLNHPISRTTDANGKLLIGLRTNGSDYILTDYETMLNEGSSPLPYEPYGKQKILFYANGQPLADYTIYGNTGGVGDATSNEFTGDISQFDNQGGTGSTYEYFKLTGDYTITLTCKGDCTVPSGVTIGLNADGGVVTGGYTTLVAQRGNYTQGQVITGITSDNGYQYVYIYGGSTTLEWIVEHFDIMLNKGNTALPYEPYGYKIPVICGGQTTNIYLDSPLGANDSIDYTTSQVNIPTVDGENTLICDTNVQPSKVSLSYTGWHSDLDKVFESIDNKQDTIDSSHKLDADLVDDTNTTNKFVTASEKTTISKAVTTDNIGLGTDYFIFNGIRVYFSATEPTGDIPDNSLWFGGDVNFVIDAILDTTSTNAIQNQAVANAIGDINTVLEEVL